MHAVFLAPEEDCHYSPEESRKTRVSGTSVNLADLISEDKSRKEKTREEKRRGPKMVQDSLDMTPRTPKARQDAPKMAQ